MPKYRRDDYFVTAKMLEIRKVLHDQKQRVAFSSVLAAAFLIALKLYVGLLTNSLGILSEALHSGLDFIAALVTMSAVVSASRPADSDHHFGHGKSENFSALIETVLLLATCIWIFSESIDRIFISQQAVDASIAAFVTMAISIIINVSRTRALYRTAKKYNSQALEADALHFSTDILGSAVVIAGLVFVSLGLPLGDPLGAIGVGVLVLFASVKLGKRAADYLMDKAPAGLTEAVKKNISSLEGVKIERIRVRSAGPNQFVDLRISLDRSLSLESSRDVVSKVEGKVWEVIAGADVVVQVEPRAVPDEDLSSKVILIASKEKGIKHVHNILAQKVGEDTVIDLHLEVDPNIKIKDAHELVTNFESKVKSQLGIARVNSHIETREKESIHSRDMTHGQPNLVNRIEKIVHRFPEIIECHDISVRSMGGRISVSMHCVIQADKPVARAHEVTTDLENALKSEITGLDYVTIHVEPETKP